ncbi:polysaccharide deacetylase family protein, partial [Salmonella enterica]|uniref:polysaccharide deacetylase family protein n=1 Tax=Salmonella enterica TaxID=28901 RepID=UPI00398C392F
FLKFYDENNIKNHILIPRQTLDTFPAIIKAIFAAGYGIAHHGYYHESPTLVNRATERRLMDLAFACYNRHFGIRPVGYRSSYWDYSENTLDRLDATGFLYDVSLLAKDLVLYHPTRWPVNLGTGNMSAPVSRMLEI